MTYALIFPAKHFAARRKEGMVARPSIAGRHGFQFLRIASLRVGILTGIYLSCVFVAWLDVANRVAELEPYAELRNLIGGALLVAVGAIPALRFRSRPGKLFVSGLTAWSLLTVTYLAAELHFTLLGSRMGALHVFMLGAVCYGLVAVFDWVLQMCVLVRHADTAHSRETPPSPIRHNH
jgi:hypothetical protein